MAARTKKAPARKPARRKSASGSREGKRNSSKAPPARAAEPAAALQITAADVMVREVHAVHPDTPVDEVEELFQYHNINGAPVVDEEGTLLGIVSTDDLGFARMGYTGEVPPTGEPVPGRGLKAVARVSLVSDIMTPKPFHALEETPLAELCARMWHLKIHHIPIVREGKLVGIVSSLDVCRLIAESGAAMPVPGDLPEPAGDAGPESAGS